MATDTSSIDDLLMGGTSSLQPQTPESQENVVEEEQISYGDPEVSDTIENKEVEALDPSSKEDDEHVPETDEYGNQKAKPRVYTEDEVNERINKAIRERLARMKNQEQPMPSVQQVAQAQQDFNYNPDADGNWQQQLETFVEQTFNKINQRQVTQAQQMREKQAHQEFEEKFTNGMEKFQDFREVVSAQPISDPMTLALRGMKDPAAFIYAASKRQPAELQRISQISDPYTQMVEMGRLEERMRKVTNATKAPRPLGRSIEDTGMPRPVKKQEGDSIEDLIAKADAKRRSQLAARRSR